MAEQLDLIEETLTALQRLGASLTPSPERNVVRTIIAHTSKVLECLEEARLAGASAMSERARFQCCCRCKQHQQVGCPLCLDVYGCPEHADPPEELLRKGVLEKPEELARELFNIVNATDDEGERLPSWDDEPDDEWKRTWIEACRKVVTSRVVKR